MPKAQNAVPRRSFLGALVVLPGLAGLLTARVSADASKAQKSAMHYQSTPSGNMQCSGCKFFIPGSDPKADGTCQVVDGAISPNGYCMAFSAK